MAIGNWYKLDNAAKIVPSTAHGANSRVFRISCELKEEVDAHSLQLALEQTLDEFPFFNCVLKKGLFWYYLEERNLKPEVYKDNKAACAPIYFPGKTNLLYRVNYYHKRINLEMFHVLADGTGAFMFFKHLIANYLVLVHHLEPVEIKDDISSVQEKNDDAFKQFYERTKGLQQLKSMSAVKAYQLRGELDDNMLSHMVEGTVPAGEMVKLAKSFQTTVGILCVAIYVAAAIDGMSNAEKKYPVSVSVPVNLRQYFPSDTARNFFGVINIRFYASDYDGTLESVIPKVKESFATQLSYDNILKTMNSYSALEHNLAIKFLPLALKDIGIHFFDSRAKRGVTTSISNLGQIKMPQSLTPYIMKFSAFMTAPSQQICISSFGDQMVFGEVSPYKTHGVMLNFYRKLVSLGIPVVISTNDYDEEVSEHATVSKM
ncbi:MAG: hypothetical protein K6G23_01075 [Lachnospiraceae bacterium]|nr:hypothetical protein [Lachnospiraceae bacterium]